MVEVKRLEVWKPHLGSYRNVGDGYENQQFFRTSLQSLVAVGGSRKQEYLRHRVEKTVAVKSGSSMHTILLGGLCGCIFRESQTQDTKQNLQGSIQLRESS